MLSYAITEEMLQMYSFSWCDQSRESVRAEDRMEERS